MLPRRIIIILFYIPFKKGKQDKGKRTQEYRDHRALAKSLFGWWYYPTFWDPGALTKEHHQSVPKVVEKWRQRSEVISWFKGCLNEDIAAKVGL